MKEQKYCVRQGTYPPETSMSSVGWAGNSSKDPTGFLQTWASDMCQIGVVSHNVSAMRAGG